MRPLVVLAFSLPLTGQALNPLAYPQDTITNGGGWYAPLGVQSFGPYAESRTQLLIPADHLPSTGGALHGIAVHCVTYDGPWTYTSLVIDASITTVSALGTTFASNLLAPVRVLQAQNFVVTWSRTQWTEILFTTPFTYPGGVNLVLDIRNVSVPLNTVTLLMELNISPSRNDLPRMRFAHGGVGSGMAQAATSTMANWPLECRLLWSGIPTMTLRSDLTGTGNTFALGGSIAVTTYGTPGSLYLTQAGFALAPVAVPPVAGSLYVSGVTIGVSSLGSTGSHARTLVIPVNPGLVGLHLAFQSGVLDAQSNLASWTCASDCFINP